MPDKITNQVMTKILERIGAHVRDEAKRRCPVDNGHLRNSIEYKISGPNSVIIFSSLPYADYIEYGTGIYHLDENGRPSPHSGWDIVPVKANCLAFEVGRLDRLASKGSDKNMVFTKKVHVDGMRAQPFLRPALHQSIPFIKQIIADELSK